MKNEETEPVKIVLMVALQEELFLLKSVGFNFSTVAIFGHFRLSSTLPKLTHLPLVSALLCQHQLHWELN